MNYDPGQISLSNFLWNEPVNYVDFELIVKFVWI